MANLEELRLERDGPASRNGLHQRSGGKGEVGGVHGGRSRGVKAALRGDVRSVDRRVVPNEVIRRWTQIYADGERRTVLNLRESASSADASSLAQLVGLFRW